MSDRNKSAGSEEPEEKNDHGTHVVPGSSSEEPTITPRTSPPPQGGSEADPAGINNVTDSMPND